MIEIGGTIYYFDRPLIIAGGVALALFFMLVLAIVLAIRSAGRRATAASEPLSQQINALGQIVQRLGDGQQQLSGGLAHVSEAQAKAQLQMVQTMEQRLEEMQRGMADTLHGTNVRTTRSLTELQERLATIDKAQSNIEKLSGDVLSLQDILSNKQTRGAFGEIQLKDIVSKALPPNAYSFQATLSNGKRADCLIHLPNPPGPIVVDSKFPLEPYEALVRSVTEAELKEAARLMRGAVRAHIRAIAEKYILDGETADGALMFLPSEAVYAELHANFPDLVRKGFEARVWIVSPTTCMATLNTMRAILKDAQMREQAGAIRRELSLLTKDVERLETRVGNLDRHFGLAAKDLREIKTSADKIGRRSGRLETFEFEDQTAEEAPVVTVIP
ncbi:DNA recombination protein RmuC [Halovulum sp. GXIMD14793]